MEEKDKIKTTTSDTETTTTETQTSNTEPVKPKGGSSGILSDKIKDAVKKKNESNK